MAFVCEEDFSRKYPWEDTQKIQKDWVNSALRNPGKITQKQIRKRKNNFLEYDKLVGTMMSRSIPKAS